MTTLGTTQSDDHATDTDDDGSHGDGDECPMLRPVGGSHGDTGSHDDDAE